MPVQCRVVIKLHIKTTDRRFREKFREIFNFPENLRKCRKNFANFRMLFAFSRKLNLHFRFNPT
jgi:hypothetical protein